MSGYAQLSPYLNRFTTLWQDKADVKLEFTCKDGNVIVNLSHNLGGIEKVPDEVIKPYPYAGHVLKKNISLSQIMRLKKRAAERAAAEKLEAEKVKASYPPVREESVNVLGQGNLVEAESATADIAQFDAKKAKIIADETEKDAMSAKLKYEKTRIEADKAKNEAEEARSVAEQAMDEAEQAKSDAEQAKREAELAKSEARDEAEQAKREAEQAKTEAEEAKDEAQKANR